MQNKLILFTADYPYGTGETFLETEIGYLVSAFDEVLIVSANTKDEQTRILPDNCIVERIDLSVSPGQKFFALFQLFDARFWEELKVIRRIYKIPLSRGIISTMLISLYRAKRAKRLADKIQNKTNPRVKMYFYSYWCDDVAIALAMLQKEHKTIKTFCRIHRWDVYFEESKVNYLPYRHLITENIGMIFSISQDGIDYALEKWHTLKQSKFTLSRLGIHNSYPFEIVKNEPFLVVSCSNLIPVKRVHLIAEALQEITDVTIKWVHIGDGPERNSIENRIQTLPKNIQVELKGRMPNSEIYAYYSKHHPDLFVNVSSSEGVPVSIMEAMSFGIPVIATDVGGNREIVNEKNGRLVHAQITKTTLAKHFRDLIHLKPKDKKDLKENAFETWKLYYNAEKNYYTFVCKIQEIK